MNTQRRGRVQDCCAMKFFADDVEVWARSSPEALADAFTIWSVWPGLGHALVLRRPVLGLAWFCATVMGYVLVVLPGVALHWLCIRQGRRLAREQWARECGNLPQEAPCRR